MNEVLQAFDRTPIAQLDGDDAAALDRKIEAARRLFADRVLGCPGGVGCLHRRLCAGSRDS
jgi:hypothetical protein